MKNRPLYENLDTSFVNLSALIRFLRRRRFAGFIRLEIGDYKAEISLSAENQLTARESDPAGGGIAEDDETLQRILIRAREPDGTISVYQTAREAEIIESQETAAHVKSAPPARAEKPSAPQTKLTGLPFEFSNKFERRAKPAALSSKEREMLLSLTGELLGTLDRTLAAAELDFASAFRTACAEISDDYPFLTTLDYENGKIQAGGAHTNPQIFAAGLCQALRRILESLAENPRFAETHRAAAQKILALIHRRRALCDRFFMTRPLERILGV